MTDEQKAKLILRLVEERKKFSLRGQDTRDHTYAIDFLVHGTLPLIRESVLDDNYELLQACRYDVETLLRDYEVI